MGLIGFTCTIGTALFGFLYPSYATFKVLAGRPATEPEIESWMFYWCVIGIVAGAEHMFEWLVNWFPLYYEAKFLFILWLVSPGTQGSTYLYKAYVSPFFSTNTRNIDQLIASAQTNAIGFVQSSLQAAWAFLVSRLTNAQAQATQNIGPAPGQAGNPAQNGPLQGMLGMWKQFGPAVLAAGTSLLNPAQNKNAAQQAVNQQTFPNPSAPNPMGTPGASTQGGDQLRYRSTAPAEGRQTPPPSFPVPQHQY
ncbi:hypothetical protein CPB86DRAFT_804227 [Serendipita vermifera]|nr:hypothetical protein CPB86DRAFT_804227 [Serendipita vermifera]